jgi:hypothetical protein
MICFIYLIIESAQHKMSNPDIKSNDLLHLVIAQEELDHKHIKC